MYNFNCKLHLVPFHTSVFKIQDICIPVTNAKRSRYWEDSLPMFSLSISFMEYWKTVGFPSQVTWWAGPVLRLHIVQGQLDWERNDRGIHITMHSVSLVPLSHARNSKSIETLTFPALELQRSPVAVAAGILDNNPWARQENHVQLLTPLCVLITP